MFNTSNNVLPESDSPTTLANDFSNYFVEKVGKIRNELDQCASSSSNQSSQFLPQSDIHVECKLSDFSIVTEDKLYNLIMKCPSKSCLLDPMPTWLVKQHLQTLLPILTTIVNTSLASGAFPAELRKAIITPILKKASLDKNQLKHYRPVSNLAFIGKLIEKVVASQVSDHTTKHDLSDPYQSAYKCAHSTETALVCVQNDILRAIDNRHAVFLLMLDLSAAFDTVDHGILLKQLTDDFGLTDNVHTWFQSYLCSRTSKVCVKGVFSDERELMYGVPQGSVIGPQAFTYYTRRVGQIIVSHGLKYHKYADDVQIYTTFNPDRPGDAACALFKLSKCVSELQTWMLHNRLKLNQDKTEFFIASSDHHVQNLQHLSLHLPEQEVFPSKSIRNLGVIFDRCMKMTAHITHLSRSINWQIRNLNRIRKYLDVDTCHNIVRALILSRLDYCNSLMNGIDRKDLARLQVLQNKCARLILKQPKRSHASPLLQSLHWLPVAQRIQYKSIVQTYKSFNLSLPGYISVFFQIHSTAYALRSSSVTSFVVPRSNKKAGDRAFSIAAPRLWDALPASIRSADNLTTFKRLLKSHLFPSP